MLRFAVIVFVQCTNLVQAAFGTVSPSLLWTLQQQQQQQGAEESPASAAAAVTFPHRRSQLRRPAGSLLSTTTTALGMSKTEIDTNDENDEKEHDELHLVLFGIGDLRTDDHVGLRRAMQQSSSSSIAALCVLDETTWRNIPGVVSHTADTVAMVLDAVQALGQDLQANHGIPLSVVIPPAGITTAQVLETLSQKSNAAVVVGKNKKEDTGNSYLHVHVHDLGDADNQMGYGPWGQWQQKQQQISGIELHLWTAPLRERPWQDVRTLPDTYTEFRRQYLQQERPMKPVDDDDNVTQNKSHKPKFVELPELGSLFDGQTAIDAQVVLEHVTQLLNLSADRVKAETNTGLYMTHWGGLAHDTVGCRAALEVAHAYLGGDVQSDDTAWTRHPLYPGRTCRRNGRSLEHASMMWQLRGRGTNTPTGDVKDWLRGESFIRWAAAPLLLGTISPRRLWHLADQYEKPLFWFQNPIKTLVEAREWHILRAAHNIRTDPMYAPTNGSTNSDGSQTKYHYWRYHGYLCRYAVTEMNRPSNTEEKTGILLVHGFGASGAQWNKAMDALSDDSVFVQGLAPDLLGFGEAEKPSISYTAYLWDSMVCDFIKDRALATHGWDSFVLGGNSIGGFTSMSTAASDCAPVKEEGRLTVTSSGAPGTKKCSGLVLMNSAGPIQTEEEVQTMLQQSANTLERASVAQITALDALPPCSPPPRPVARTFGNALLTYLRPNIQSICKNLYPTNPSAVDDNLCRGILRDSLDPGAINVMMAGAKLPSPRSANELLQADFRLGTQTEESTVHESSFDGPVLIAQGVLDPLNDAMDRMNRFGALRSGITMSPIQAGHCPHDELPSEVAQSISKWTTTIVKKDIRVAATN